MSVTAVQPPAVEVRQTELAKPARIHALPDRYQELDGLRGLCALSVVLFHYLIGPSGYCKAAYYLRELIYVSPLTVDMFFIFSGFLVGTILLNTRTSPNYYKTFYFRRMFRVIPIYYLWVMTFIVLVRMFPGSRHAFLPDNISLRLYLAEIILFVQNFATYPKWNLTAHWFGTSWSLAVEEHFYFLAPVCLHRISRRRLLQGLIAIIVLSPIARVLAWYFRIQNDSQVLGIGAANYWTPFRADGLAIGILLAILWQTPDIKTWICDHLPWIYCGLVLAAPICVGFQFLAIRNPAYGGALSVGFGRSAVEVWSLFLILIALVNQGKKSISALRWSLLREVGKVSYCLYLIHWGVLWAVLHFVFHARPGDGAWSDGIGGIIAFALALGVSVVSWKYMEGPLQRRGHLFSY